MSRTSNPFRTIAECVELACRLEATAPKAGNVHPGADFEDTTFADFIASAVAVAPAFEHAAHRGVGPTVLDAVERRNRVVSVNTNLGIILLIAPLAAVPRGVLLSAGIADVLVQLTAADADTAYRGIRLSGAGGLGTVATQDIGRPPSETLREVMQRAADRDLVARQYANQFDGVLHDALPKLADALQSGLSIETAIVRTHLALMAETVDTLIARKCGLTEAEEASRRAATVLAANWPARSAASRFRDFDAWLRARGNARNPGSTADIVTAALFAGLRDDIIPVPSTFLPHGKGHGPESRS